MKIHDLKPYIYIFIYLMSICTAGFSHHTAIVGRAIGTANTEM